MRLNQYIAELSQVSDDVIIDGLSNKPGSKYYYEISIRQPDSSRISSVFYFHITKYGASSVTTFGPTITDMLDKEFPFDYWMIGFEDENGNTDMTPKGKGEALKLFAAIQKVMADFVKAEKPEVVVFSGWGESKFKLYSRLAKMLAKGMGGKYEIQGSPSSSTYYIWR